MTLAFGARRFRVGNLQRSDPDGLLFVAPPALYAALQCVRDQGMHLTGWLDFFVEALATQTDEVTERGKRVIRRDVIGHEYGLNPRQVLAVGHLLEKAELRIEELEALCPGMNRRTLHRDLQGLVQQGVAKAAGAASTVRYKLRIKGL